MAFTDSIVLADASAVNQTFSLNFRQGNSSDRIDELTPISAARSMSIRHNYVAKTQKADAYDRHVVTFKKAVIDSDDKQHVVTVSLPITTPRSSEISRGDIDDLLAFVSAFIADSVNIDKMLRNEN